MRKRKRKIFKPRRNYRIKKKNENALKILVGVFGVALLVFVGYSAVQPISEFIKREKLVTQQYSTSETEPSVTTALETEAPTEEPVSEATNEILPPPPALEIYSGKAVMLAEDVTQNEQMLYAALEKAASEGASSVIIPMKTTGGIYRYKTSSRVVATAVTDPVKSSLTAEQIASAAREKGLAPCAYVSVLTDNNRYGDSRTAAYHSSDGAPWVDGDPSKGGKPWISPFSQEAADFLCEMCAELGDAGFSRIVCDDFVFPEFKERDIQMLGSDVADEAKRNDALARLVKSMTNSARSSGANVLVRLPVREVLKGSGILSSEMFSGCTILIDMGKTAGITKVNGVDISALDTAHRTSAVYNAAIGSIGDIQAYPMFASSAEDNSIEDALAEIDVKAYYVY